MADADGASYDYDLFCIGAGSGGVRASRMSSGFGGKVAVRFRASRRACGLRVARSLRGARARAPPQTARGRQRSAMLLRGLTHRAHRFTRRSRAAPRAPPQVCEMPFATKASDTAGGAGGTCVIRGCVPKKLLVCVAPRVPTPQPPLPR
jgi:hypothetical protein